MSDGPADLDERDVIIARLVRDLTEALQSWTDDVALLEAELAVAREELAALRCRQTETPRRDRP